MKWGQKQISTAVIKSGAAYSKVTLAKYTKEELLARAKANKWVMQSDNKSFRPEIIKDRTVARGTNPDGSACGGMDWVPEEYWTCAVVPTGDDVADQERCQEIGEWTESPTEGDWVEQPPCDPETPTECDLWGTNCPGDEEDPGDGCTDCEQPEENNSDTIPPNPCDSLVINNNEAKNLLDGKYQNYQEEDDQFSILLDAFGDAAEHSPIERSVSIKFRTTLPNDGMASTPPTYDLGTTDIQLGGENSVTTITQTNEPDWTIIGGIHSHPNNTRAAPSVADLYHFYNANQGNPNYQYQFIFSYDGSRYVYTITDRQAFSNFINGHPQSQYVGANDSWNVSTPLGADFDKTMVYLMKEKGLSENNAYELALAYSLSQNNIGVTLSKRDANGDFKGIHVNKDAAQNKKKYNKVTPTTNCNL